MMPSAKVLAVEDTSTASDLWVSDTGSFAEIFEESSSNLDFDELNVLPNSVRYSYTMTSVDAEESPYVILAFTIQLPHETIDFTTRGSVESTPYKEDTYFQGKLVGEQSINNVDYLVTVGFQKLASSDNIKVGVVLTGDNSNGEDMGVIFTFGNRVLSYEEWVDFQQEDLSNVPVSEVGENLYKYPIAPYDLNDKYYLYCTHTMTIPGSSNIVNLSNAGKMNYYFAPQSLRGVTCVQSNCAGLKTALNKIFTGGSRINVSSIEYTMERISGNGYIAGFEYDAELPKGSTIAISQPIRALFVDILGFLGSSAGLPIPTSFISAVIDSLEGKITTSNGTKNLNATYTGTFNFDDGYLPITYQFDAGTGGRTKYECSTTIEYRAVVSDAWGDSTTLYFVTEPDPYQFFAGQ